MPHPIRLAPTDTLGVMGLLTVELMHATEIVRPFHRDGWVYEEKVDGYRMVAYKDRHSHVTLISRNGRDHTKRFPELVDALGSLGTGAVILDGEVAVYDRQLISRFEWLRHRAPPDLATPPLFIVFDCLSARGKDLRKRRLSVRRNIVEDMLDGQDMLLPVRRLAADGLKAWREVLDRGYEGLVAKDATSPYVGGRTLKWLKVKQPKYREVERGIYKPSPAGAQRA